jgi:DNA invertase Pin-like site-specific DNA recombinase
MRVAGYARESSVGGGSLYAQSERIRRWVSEQGHQLVAMCQDVRGPAGEPADDGFGALLEVVGAHHADAVIIPSLEALSTDLLVQEIILHDLRRRDIKVISTVEDDARVLADARVDPARLLVRDVLERRDEYERSLSRGPSVEAVAAPDDVVIELIPAQSA